MDVLNTVRLTKLNGEKSININILFKSTIHTINTDYTWECLWFKQKKKKVSKSFLPALILFVSYTSQSWNI